MVKKLFKHEFLAMGRLTLPVLAGILGVGTLTRLIYVFESDNVFFNIVGVSAFIMLFMGILAGGVLCTVFGITRFYKNLFCSEGYLSFTLPVTATQHLIVKLVTAVSCSLATLLTGVLSVMIAFSGDALVEIFKAIGYLFGNFAAYYGMGNSILYIIEFALLLIVAEIFSFLLFYFCLTVGQTARKARIGKAIGVFFIIYGITQVLSTILIALTIALEDTPLMLSIVRFLLDEPAAFMHTTNCIVLAVYCVISVVFFFVCRHIMTKKLNVE